MKRLLGRQSDGEKLVTGFFAKGRISKKHRNKSTRRSTVVDMYNGIHRRSKKSWTLVFLQEFQGHE
jgi:hypothetical protein